MAAALACLRILQRENVVATRRRSGQALMEGLVNSGRKYGYNVLPSGPPAVPFISIEADASMRRQQRFCAEVSQRGGFLHPHHNWFMSAAHSSRDIAATLEMADQAFAVLRAQNI
jgi:glutamate-1-semialdehyde 2,1-aminomutase